MAGVHSEGVAAQGWAGLTVCVAWSLLSEGVRVRSAVLDDVRDHVLFHLEPSTPLPHAEDRARHLVAGLVSRARRRPISLQWPQDAAMPLSPRWRRALERSLSPLSQAVFRQHYGDGRDLATLEQLFQVDQIALEACRAGLREVIRRAAADDGLPLHTWPNERLDQLLRRLAAFSPGPCPPLAEVVEGRHPEHQGECTRCDRAARLISAGVLQAADLVPPAQGTRPEGEVEILALHFHPDGRRHRDRLAKEAGVTTMPVGDDVLLLDWSEPEAVAETLRLAAEVGSPRRDLIRGAVLDGPGRWSPYGLLGPLAERATEEVQTRSWGMVDTLGELPVALPEPPSARRWWTGVAALAGLLVATASLAFSPPHHVGTTGLDVEFTEGRGGVWAHLDVNEDALLTIVSQDATGLHVVHRSVRSPDKASLAVGDGSYRLHALGSGLVVMASQQSPTRLETLLDAASSAPDPLSDLVDRLQSAEPRADVVAWTR